MAKFLNHLLSKYANNIPNQVLNSSNVKRNILSLNTPPEVYSTYTILSLDIVSLFPSVEVDRAIDIVCNLYAHDNDIEFPDITPKILKDLLDWACITVFYFKNQVYKQIKGLPMGLAISPLLANIFLHHVIELDPKFDSPYIALYNRYVDDCLVLWKGPPETIDPYVSNLNLINPSIYLFIYSNSHSAQRAIKRIHIRRYKKQEGRQSIKCANR